ncbi:hypothetical protein [Microbacterium sp. GXF7504]
MTDDMHTDGPAPVTEEPVVADAPAADPQYGVGPFSIRETAIGGIWLVAFVLSFIPVFGGGTSLWGLGLSWVLTIGVPTVAVFLLVLRRLSPDGIRRVGSLGIDQFASVAFSVAAVSWLAFVWQQVSIAIVTGVTGAGSWLIWIEFILMLGGVACTVFAPLLPVLREDFRHRPESVAHPAARRLRPIAKRPPRPAAPAPAGAGAHASGQPAPAFQQPGPGFQQQVPAWDGRQQPAYAAAPTAQPAPAEEAETTVLDRLDPTAHAEPAAVAADEPATAPQDDPLAVFEPDATPEPVAESEAVAERESAFEPEPVTAVYDVAAEPVQDQPVQDEPVQAEPVQDEPVQAEPVQDEPAAEQPAPQAFWVLAPEERDVLDASGAPIFRIGPTAWALVIEDRGEVFVMRHEDGRIGYLHDVSGVTRG